MGHWLPLFHAKLDTLFDYLPGTPVALEPLAEDAAHERFAQIADYYEARRQALEADRAGTIYKPLAPGRLYLTEEQWSARLDGGALARLSSFADPDAAAIDAGTHRGRGERLRRCDQTRPRAAGQRQARRHRDVVGRLARSNEPRARRPRPHQ